MPLTRRTDKESPHSCGTDPEMDRQADYLALAKAAEMRSDWMTASHWYSLALDQRATELAQENAKLVSAMQKRLAHLAALQETSRAIVSTLDLNELLKLIIQQATTL